MYNVHIYSTMLFFSLTVLAASCYWPWQHKLHTTAMLLQLVDLCPQLLFFKYSSSVAAFSTRKSSKQREYWVAFTACVCACLISQHVCFPFYSYIYKAITAGNSIRKKNCTAFWIHINDTTFILTLFTYCNFNKARTSVHRTCKRHFI